MIQAQPSRCPHPHGGEDPDAVHYDIPGAYARLMAAASSPTPLPAPGSPGTASFEEAGQQLDLLCTSVVLDPQASRNIALLAHDRGLTTAGAVAFGCLLHLAGEEAAGFWWALAAGAGESEAAYLLMLDHKRRAELRDEELWRDRLIEALDSAPASRPAGPCWQDQQPLGAQERQELRRAAEYAERHEHEDLGDIWVPTPRLAMAVLAVSGTLSEPAHDAWDPNPPEVPGPAPEQAPGQAANRSGTACPQPEPAASRPGAAPEPPPARTRLWTPPSGQQHRRLEGGHDPAHWEDSLRVLDVLQLIRETGCADTATVARTAGITLGGAAGLLAWLDTNGLTRPLDPHTHGPGPLLAEIACGASVLQGVLDQIRDDTGAAIYVSTYTDGEIVIPHLAWGPQAPQVTMTVDFKETPHASAVGKSLLAQLSPDQRSDLLSRHQPKPFTSRTITDPARLIDTIDRCGPLSPYFDVLEYSDAEVCAAISLPLPGRACSVALSLPVAAQHRLVDTTKALSDRSIGLLLALVLATDPASTQTPAPSSPEPEQPPSAAPSRLWTPAPAIRPPVLAPHLAGHRLRTVITQ
ncbi:IclR family transcriptional regulator domain-containing protein [Streptomyces sp. NPDC004436]